MSLYLLIKSYSNSLVAEVSQQMYGGVLRCISLGSTEGLSTWRCSIQLNVQAAAVSITVGLAVLGLGGGSITAFPAVETQGGVTSQ